MLTVEEILEEYYKCISDPCYAIETYFKTFDKTQEGFVPFKLFDKQKEILHAYKDHRFNMVTKPRQAGVSTTTAAYAAVIAAFADKENPEQILILANKQDMAFEFLDKIKDFLRQIPRWAWGAEYYGSVENEERSIFLTDSKKELKLPNRSRIRAVATSKDALRGFTPTWLIMDEAAFIENGATVFGAALTALGTGGRAALVSTPNGMDALYYTTYNQSKSGFNDFHVVEMKWYQDPRYNGNTPNGKKDLSWIHEDNENDVIPETEWTHEHYEEMIKKGYKPTSIWYRSMCRGMNNDKRMIAQELDVSFIGSGGNVIDVKDISRQVKNHVTPPLWKAGDKNEIWIWEKPIEGHQYILGSDVSRGDGADSSTMWILDFTTMTQVVEFKSKLQSDLLGYVVDEYARIYDALVVIDITGGSGVGTVNKCMELATPNLYYGESTNKPLDRVTNKVTTYTNEGKYPGFNVGPGLRAPLIAHMEMMVRTEGVKVRSERTITEMETFVFKNGRADHQEGFHDDLLMAMGYALWVAENSFKKLKKSKEKTRAILDGWLMVTNDLKEDNANNREGFVPKNSKGIKAIKKPNFSHTVSKNMQDPSGQYMWLFSGTR